MLNLTLNVGSLIVNGLTIGATAMDASSQLRIHQPEPEPAVGHPNTQLIVDEVLRHLRGEPSPASGSPQVGPKLIGAGESLDTRTTSPGVNQIHTLRQVFDHLYNRAKTRKTESSWSGYRTLLRYWERFQAGAGPCVTAIDRDSLQRFFEAVPEWHSRRSWERNRDLLFALLKSSCAESSDNQFGRDRSAAVLSRDDLPVWRLPEDQFFRNRPKATGKGGQKRGGHRKRNIPLLTVDEFGGVLEACNGAEFMQPLFWKTWLSLLWYNGHRFEDSLAYCWDTGQLHVNLTHRLLDFTESKCGGVSAVPMPSWLVNHLMNLRDASGTPASGQPVFALPKGQRLSRTQTSDFRLPRGDLTNRARRFDKEYVAIWERAGVPIRHPHEMRAVAISHWLKHAEKYRFAATGHKPPGGDVQLRSYVILDQEFYDAAESFPYPK